MGSDRQLLRPLPECPWNQSQLNNFIVFNGSRPAPEINHSETDWCELAHLIFIFQLFALWLCKCGSIFSIYHKLSHLPKSDCDNHASTDFTRAWKSGLKNTFFSSSAGNRALKLPTPYLLAVASQHTWIPANWVPGPEKRERRIEWYQIANIFLGIESMMIFEEDILK